ncbi:MAG: hypothetical protein ACKO96_26680 [Flammeovirgaceae bacterium]
MVVYFDAGSRASIGSGGVVVAKGLVDENLSQELIGGVMTIVGAVWSIVSKKKAA